jgi:hypothetical protein
MDRAETGYSGTDCRKAASSNFPGPIPAACGVTSDRVFQDPSPIAASPFLVACTPLNEFLGGLDATAKKQAEALGLRHFEIRPMVQSFKTVLKARKTRALDWSQGWPQIKYSGGPRVFTSTRPE